MIPTIVYYHTSLAIEFFVLGTFITLKSLRYKVFNLMWAGFLIISYSLYFLGNTLNFLGFITGIWNLILQAFYYGIQLLCLIFTKKTFYKFKSNRFLVTITCIIVVLGVICSTISMFGDTELPVINVYDDFDMWRLFLSNIIANPIVYAPLLLATWREYKNTKQKEHALSRRFLIYFMSVLASIITPVFYELEITLNFLKDISVFLVLSCGVFSTIALYLAWIFPEKGKHKELIVDTSKTLKIGSIPMRETIVTSIATFHVIENLGATLSEVTGQSAHACNGLLLLLIEKELGFDSLRRLDLAKLVPFFDGPLRQYLALLKIPDTNAAISALKSRLAEKYAAFSMDLF